MDFEEQLEKAEKLSAPSLVGASLRSADDSAHQNYIHPEKSKPKKHALGGSVSSVPTSIDKLTASLDDLINEGALLGSEENFDSYLDTEGNVVKSEFAKRPASHADIKKAEAAQDAKETAKPELPNLIPGSVSSVDVIASSTPLTSVGGSSSSEPTAAQKMYKQSDYSTPNLSEYQLANEITDHADLLANIQSHDPHRLPTDGSKLPVLKTPTTETFRKLAVSSPAASDSPFKKLLLHVSSLGHESIHSPYFYTDSTPLTHTESVRSRSRSRSQNPPGTPHAISQPSAAAQERSRSRSAIRPHLARGDSYKLTHDDEPSKYELPADFTSDTVSVREDGDSEITTTDVHADAKGLADVSASSAAALATPDRNSFVANDEEEEDDRRSRASRPTMGDLIAAAERELEKQDTIQNQLLRDPSLVTTGDYTNYNVDTPVPNYNSDLVSERLLSSMSYLRSISRSRSRQPQHVNVSKDDATLKELVAEGALISDDPYSTIDQLDSMVENVLTKDEKAEKAASLTHTQDKASLTKTEKVTTEEPEAHIDELLDELKESKLEDDSAEVNETPAEAEPEAEPQAETEIEKDAEKKESESTETETTETTEDEGAKEVTEAAEPEVHVEATPAAVEELKEIKKKEDEEEDKSSTKTKDDDLDLETMEVSPEELRAHLEAEPVYIFTSLAGGMQIMPRTNRLATILTANQIQFTYRDLGTDDAAKKIWKTYSKGKTLPGIVRGDDFIGNWQDIEEANEEYRLRELLYETL